MMMINNNKKKNRTVNSSTTTTTTFRFLFLFLILVCFDSSCLWCWTTTTTSSSSSSSSSSFSVVVVTAQPFVPISVWEANTPCPLGYICDEDRMANCHDIRAVALDTFALGDVYAGIRCPYGHRDMSNCPAGFYCPDPSTEIECSEGYYCPHKSSQEDWYECRNCIAGSTSIARELFGYFIMGILFLFIIVSIGILILKRTKSELFHDLIELKKRRVDSLNLMKRRRERIQQLERLKPKLLLISTRLANNNKQFHHHQNNNNGHKQQQQQQQLPEIIIHDDGTVKYDAGRLFDAIDIDQSGDVTFNELNAVLELTDNELAEFVKRMNHLAAASSAGITTLGGSSSNENIPVTDDDDRVTRPVFCQYFLHVLEETSHFATTPNEAGTLFDEIASEAGGKAAAAIGTTSFAITGLQQQQHQQQQQQQEQIVDEIRADVLYTSKLTRFLTDSQINYIIRKIRERRERLEGEDDDDTIDDPAAAAAAAADNQDNHNNTNSNTGSTRPNRPKLHALSVAAGAFVTQMQMFQMQNVNTIRRDEFIQCYPILLNEVCNLDDFTLSMMNNNNSNSSEDEEQQQQQDTAQQSQSTLNANKSSGVDIAFEDLSLAVKAGDGSSINVVDQVTGRLQAHTMTALMGGSGAGKTSLLNALCGRAFYGTVTGNVHVNGHLTSIEEHKHVVGFVPQDDIVYAELTVRENFIYSGLFRLPKGTSKRDIEDLADTTMANLGLSRVANSVVGDVKRRGVSGGEKKRVNIGLELMSKPKAIFLDEPTSGLDASSAMLVMKSLKHLVNVQGVTVCSVIHQPRKFIYDLFDSLILLGVGGKTVYAGPTSDALAYFESLNYVLPAGESVADWLIDISSGRLEPKKRSERKRRRRQRQQQQQQQQSEDKDTGDNDDDKEIPSTSSGVETTTTTSSSAARSFDNNLGAATRLVKDSDVVGTRGITMGKVDLVFEEAKARREWLYEQWKAHYQDNVDQTSFTAPTPFDLPKTIRKPNFIQQVWYQFTRAILVGWRNRLSKLIDTAVIVGAVVLIAFFDGVVEITVDLFPDISFDNVVNFNIDQVLPQLFRYALVRDPLEFGLKAGVIASVLLGLLAAKIITEKRIEFFREAGADYDVNAFYLAVNIVATLEHSLQITIAAFFAYWMRQSLADSTAFYMNFLLLNWLCVSWSILLAIITPLDNVVLVVGFFMAFFGLLFSGGLAPVEYVDMYETGGFTELFAGFFSPTRYFIETGAVNEHRCLPEQSGFTLEAYSSLSYDATSYAVLGYAQNDLVHATQRGLDGWYWSLRPALFVGITVRFLGAGAIHVFGRSKQIKKPLEGDLRMAHNLGYFKNFWKREFWTHDYVHAPDDVKKAVRNAVAVSIFVILFLVLFSMTCAFILKTV